MTLLCSAVAHLKSLKTVDGKDSIPDNFLEEIIKIFQMTSVPEFNILFNHMETQSKVNALAGLMPHMTCSVKSVLSFVAEKHCFNFQTVGKWLGLNNKASAFACFNCGGPHDVKAGQCTIPVDKAHVSHKQEAVFHDSKKKLTAGGKGFDLFQWSEILIQQVEASN